MLPTFDVAGRFTVVVVVVVAGVTATHSLTCTAVGVLPVVPKLSVEEV